MTNTSYTNNELVEQIELYEDKICKLKMDNQSFLENYDNIIGIIDDIEVLVVGSSDVIFLV